MNTPSNLSEIKSEPPVCGYKPTCTLAQVLTSMTASRPTLVQLWTSDFEGHDDVWVALPTVILDNQLGQ